MKRYPNLLPIKNFGLTETDVLLARAMHAKAKGGMGRVPNKTLDEIRSRMPSTVSKHYLIHILSDRVKRFHLENMLQKKCP